MDSSFQNKNIQGNASTNEAYTRLSEKRNDFLPETLYNNLERSFNIDFSKVRIHRDSTVSEKMGARAYTQGNAIHFAPGEFNPTSEGGRNLIGHEFAHVAQQSVGVVKPTRIWGKGLNVNDDSSLENEADNFGKKAAIGEVIPKYQSLSLGIRNTFRVAQAKSNIVQRSIATWGGAWDTDQYDLRKDEAGGEKFPAKSGVRGIDIKLIFTPGNNADAELIGLTQSVQGIVSGSPSFTDPTKKARSITSKNADSIDTGSGETNQGTAIDRLSSRNNPIYGSPSLAAGDDLNDTPTDNNATADPVNVGDNATYQLGYRKQKDKSWMVKDASLHDAPTRSKAAKNSRHIFETTALAITGNQAGTYYGSVRWGWRTDEKANFTKIPLQAVSQSIPSTTFMKAAKLWNDTKSSSGAETADLPIHDNVVEIFSGPFDDIFDTKPKLRVPSDTQVRILNNDMTSAFIEVVDGPYAGERGYVNNIGGLPFPNVVT